MDSPAPPLLLRDTPRRKWNAAASSGCKVLIGSTHRWGEFMKTLSEAGDEELFEMCWQEARGFVASSDAVEKEAICARIERRLSALSDEDRATFIKRLEARDGGEEEWGLASRRKAMVRILREILDGSPKK
jgi:hypothetical protein